MLSNSTHFFVHLLIYWGLALGCDAIDGMPVPPAAKRVRPVLLVQFGVVAPFFALISATSGLWAGEGTWWRLLLGLVAGDFCVWAVHRHVLHSPAWPRMRLVHAVHHKPLQSAAQALESHPFEVLLLNLAAPLLPLVLLGAPSVPQLQLLSLLATANAVLTHSGSWEHLVPHGHNAHHVLNSTNYSNSLLPDWFMGTLAPVAGYQLPKLALQRQEERRRKLRMRMRKRKRVSFMPAVAEIDTTAE